MEFCKSCEDLSWNHCTSTTYRSETNGIAERAVRRIGEGTSAVLLQSGLDEKLWRIPWNVTPICETDGKTLCERQFGVSFNGPVVPFGAMLEYHPISGKDLSPLHQFGQKVLPGIFVGHALHAARIWKGDIMVADIEE